MVHLLPFHPPSASSVADSVDMVFGIELIFSVVVMAIVGGFILYFAIRYRRRSPDDCPPRMGTHYGLEALWSGATFLIFTGFFFLGATLYVHMKKPPLGVQRVYVVGKQWMWKIQHADGLGEINQLHVPVGQPIELVMTSEDVIHDFFVPAFRVKQDVIPGSYTSEWFTATAAGTYHLFCSQYCGTDHARMIGQVIALSPADYDAWRAGMGATQSTVDVGRTLLTTYGCLACHGQTAPTFAGLYLSQVHLNDGTTVIADENYLRRSIDEPSAQIVADYQQVMPTFRGHLTVEQINAMVAYIKMLGAAKSSSTQPSTTAPFAQQLQNLPPAEGRPAVSPPPSEVLPR